MGGICHFMCFYSIIHCSFISQRKSNKAKEKKARRLEERAAMDAICAKVDAANKVTFTGSWARLYLFIFSCLINPMLEWLGRCLTAERLNAPPDVKPSITLLLKCCFKLSVGHRLQQTQPFCGLRSFLICCIGVVGPSGANDTVELLMQTIVPVIDIHNRIKQIQSHVFLNA